MSTNGAGDNDAKRELLRSLLEGDVEEEAA
jgi:hypothetical protein